MVVWSKSCHRNTVSIPTVSSLDLYGDHLLFVLCLVSPWPSVFWHLFCIAPHVSDTQHIFVVPLSLPSGVIALWIVFLFSFVSFHLQGLNFKHIAFYSVVSYMHARSVEWTKKQWVGWSHWEFSSSHFTTPGRLAKFSKNLAFRLQLTLKSVCDDEWWGPVK